MKNSILKRYQRLTFQQIYSKVGGIKNGVIQKIPTFDNLYEYLYNQSLKMNIYKLKYLYNMIG